MHSVETAPRQAAESQPPLFDADGFLLDPTYWNEQLCREIAEDEEVGVLTEKHWRVLHHIRAKFLTLGALPNMRLVCRATAIPKAEVYALFGGCRVIWRVAGLPNPGEEAKTYLI
ncbi:MAG: TusE/DsrC/DsvC family sulfur relay protein [Pseudomonadota bacterium]|nr:TusE/DsrC/DsvC family sulfur relay protein [Pseudomonadota bacterium]